MSIFLNPVIIAVIAAVCAGVVFGILGFVLGGLHRKRVAEAAIGSATEEAQRIVNTAVQAICPLDLSEHLAMGTYDPAAWAYVLDAITHAGPADPARIPRATCGQVFMPGVQPLAAWSMGTQMCW